MFYRCSLRSLWPLKIQRYNLGGNLFSLQTNELVMSLDEDEQLILQGGQSLRAAGVGKSYSFLSCC